MQTEYGVRELPLKQEKHCAKCKLGIATKATNPLQTKKLDTFQD